MTDDIVATYLLQASATKIDEAAGQSSVHSRSICLVPGS